MRLMTTSDKGIALIKEFEGLRLAAYKPVATEQYYTIGYGHYGKDVAKNMRITEAEAEALLKDDLGNSESYLNAMGVNFRQEQFDALVSWLHNFGTTKFESSTLRRCILMGAEDETITDQIVRWVTSSGKPLIGLKRRRVAEANLWLGKEVYYLDTKGEVKKEGGKR